MWPSSPRVDTTAVAVNASASLPPSDGPVVAAWRRDLRIGQFVDALDGDKVWREAEVARLTDKTIRVHFRGFPVSCNKPQPLLSPRIAPANSRIKPWRGFKKGDELQVATMLHGQKDHVWSDAVVERVVLFNNQIRTRVRLDNGEKRWMDAESEYLSKPGTHKTFKSRPPRDERGDELSLFDSFTSEAARDSLPLWRLSLCIGSEVEITDTYPILWYEGRVTGTTHNQACVRYRGWPWRYDEWFPLDSERLAKSRTHLGDWREFELRQELQIGIRASPQSDHASHWVEGIITKRGTIKTSQKLVRVELQWDDASGTRKIEWRDADDDFLAPMGVTTYPLPKKTRASVAAAQEIKEEPPTVATPTAPSATVNMVEATPVQEPPRAVVIGTRDQVVEQLKRKMTRMAEDFTELQALFEHVQSTCMCHQVEPSAKRARPGNDC